MGAATGLFGLQSIVSQWQEHQTLTKIMT